MLLIRSCFERSQVEIALFPLFPLPPLEVFVVEEDEEEAEEDDEDDSFNGSVRMSNNDDSTTSYAPLTAAQLQLIGDEEKSFSDVSTSLDPDQQNKDGDISNNAPAQAQKKRLSIFNRG